VEGDRLDEDQIALVLRRATELDVVPAAAASGVAIGHRVGVSRYRSSVGDLETALEGFFDGVERRGR